MSFLPKYRAVSNIKKGMFYIAQHPQRVFTNISTTVYSQVHLYSFKQLSELGPSWRDENTQSSKRYSKGESNPGSLDCESGILPLSYRAPLMCYDYIMIIL